MAAKKKKKKKADRPSATLTLRRGRMAAKKKTKKKGAKRSSSKRSTKRKGGHRRRRNPGSGSFMSRAGHLAGGALVALATGVLVTVATGKASAGGNLALYGIPAGTFLAGAAMSKAAPTIGTGVALGAFAPFALPVASHILTAGIPDATGGTAKAAAGLGRSIRMMRAVQASGMGRSEGYRDMDAVTMRGVGAVMGDVDDYDDARDYDD